ncbi:hypothetical protein CJF42_16240 [Pseudoalteromonas sp. NBT06-2]|uniref:hypothetical protein n=1 Tax=Pseudoalteromonas sp. NBT06-2 TaxID=2025950 RepID=UPI000BA7A543|nr:hypothetical protein [Pseudoalteromonas sp. NBT06-2]PAJ73340.1 hypothetical protein CJF42_16240 [Pseudoalteromonas sp. NBT06-2]
MLDIFKILTEEVDKQNSDSLFLTLFKSLIPTFIKTLFISVIIGIALLVFDGVESLILEKVFNAFILIFVTCFFILYIYEQLLDVWRTVKNPTKDILEPIVQALEPQVELTNKLTSFKSIQLQQAIDRLNYDSQRIKSRLGLMVGAIERLGIVPFLIALFFTAHKFFTTEQMSSNYTIGLSLISGIYIGVLMCTSALQRFEYFKLVLSDAKNIVVKKEELYQSKKLEFSQLKSELQ